MGGNYLRKYLFLSDACSFEVANFLGNGSCVQKPLCLLECWRTGSIQERDLIQGTWYTPSMK